MNKTRILLVEKNHILRYRIATLINKQMDMKVVASSGGNEDIVHRARIVNPRVILIDLGLRPSYGALIVKSMRKALPEVKLIGTGLIPKQLDIVEFVQAGASGFILKDTTDTDFLATIRSVAHGEKILPPILTSSLFSSVMRLAVKNGNGAVRRVVQLTKRQREIIVLIAQSFSNKEIAQRLNIATYTVKCHVHTILGKLSLDSRVQISRYAYASHDELRQGYNHALSA